MTIIILAVEIAIQSMLKKLLMNFTITRSKNEERNKSITSEMFQKKTRTIEDLKIND